MKEQNRRKLETIISYCNTCEKDSTYIYRGKTKIFHNYECLKCGERIKSFVRIKR